MFCEHGLLVCEACGHEVRTFKIGGETVAGIGSIRSLKTFVAPDRREKDIRIKNGRTEYRNWGLPADQQWCASIKETEEKCKKLGLHAGVTDYD